MKGILLKQLPPPQKKNVCVCMYQGKGVCIFPHNQIFFFFFWHPVFASGSGINLVLSFGVGVVKPNTKEP